MQATLAPSSNASLTPRDRQLLAHPPYAQASIPETYRRHIVDYTRKEQPGTILVDTNARYLYYVLPDGKAARYGVTMGEEALAWSGVATVGRVAEWPDRIPTAEIQARLGPYPSRGPILLCMGLFSRFVSGPCGYRPKITKIICTEIGRAHV